MGNGVLASLRVRALFAWAVLSLAWLRVLDDYVPKLLAGGEGFQTGDWLINYSGGVVRRGLFGTIYLMFFPDGEAGIWVLFVIQVLLYGAVVASLMIWLHGSKYRWSAIALVCGPAAIAFVGWSQGSFGRKESLGLAAIALFAMAAKPGMLGRVGKRAATVGGLLVFSLAVFSWEGNALLLPAVLALILGTRPGWEVRVFAGTAAAVAVAGLVTAVLSPGDEASSQAICDSVRAKGLTRPDLCDGAIASLGSSLSEALAFTRAFFPVYWGYLPLLLLALLPLVASKWVRQQRLLVAASVVAIAPLFFVGVDYGRWISMFVIAISICRIALGPRQEDEGEASLWAPLASSLYVVLWGIPYAVVPGSAIWPWAGALREVVQLAMWHLPG